MIRTTFAVAKVHTYGRKHLRELERQVRHRIDRSRVDAGTMVGPIAASSIGEPCTQMTLNTWVWRVGSWFTFRKLTGFKPHPHRIADFTLPESPRKTSPWAFRGSRNYSTAAGTSALRA